jgi:hypothetical protein
MDPVPPIWAAKGILISKAIARRARILKVRALSLIREAL